MIARSESEIELFHRFDVAREQAGLRAWREAGQVGPVPPALFGRKEVPSWVFRTDDELDLAKLEELQGDDYGRGSRKRQRVTYAEELTDREFLRLADKGASQEEIEVARARKRVRVRLLNAQAAGDDVEAARHQAEEEERMRRELDPLAAKVAEEEKAREVKRAKKRERERARRQRLKDKTKPDSGPDPMDTESIPSDATELRRRANVCDGVKATLASIREQTDDYG